MESTNKLAPWMPLTGIPGGWLFLAHSMFYCVSDN